MKTVNTDAVLFAVAAFGLALCAAGAHASEPLAPVATQTVHYADLNLDTAAGAKVLYQRIRAAAEHVCGDVNTRQLELATAAQACVDQAVIAGVQAVNVSQQDRAATAHGEQAQKLATLASVR